MLHSSKPQILHSFGGKHCFGPIKRGQGGGSGGLPGGTFSFLRARSACASRAIGAYPLIHRTVFPGWTSPLFPNPNGKRLYHIEMSIRSPSPIIWVIPSVPFSIFLNWSKELEGTLTGGDPRVPAGSRRPSKQPAGSTSVYDRAL